MNQIYTIGHSNGTLEELLSLLELAQINCLVDVRSVPASTYNPQFNQMPLSTFLKSNGISYLHFGKEFGARRLDSLIDGQVNFEKAVTTDLFLRGVERIYTGLAKGYSISLMCSEANPLACHRFSMISRYFYDQGLEVQHILHSGEIKPHEKLENEMINSFLKRRNSKLQEVDLMFSTYTAEDQRRDAYILKNIEIGYRTGNEYDNKI